MSTNVVEIGIRSKDDTRSGFGSAEKGAGRLERMMRRLSTEGTRVGRGFGALGGSVGKFGSQVGGLAGGIGKVATGLGGVAGIAGGAALGLGVAAVGIGQKVIGMAGNLELMDKKSKVVFGSQIGQVQTWAGANAHAMGLTRRETVGLAASMADLLIPMKFTRAEATEMATKTIGLSGALAEWSQGQVTAAGAAEILQAAFLGERDGLQALGISISQAEVDARLLKKGQEDLTDVQLQQAEATATQELIFEKSTDAQNAYAAGAGNLARKSAETTARLKEMGQKLLVAITPGLHKIADVVNKHVMPQMERFANWLAGPGLQIMADWALGSAAMALTFADKFLGVLEKMAGSFSTWGKWLLRAMAATMAPFNWNLSQSMLKAASNLDGFDKSSKQHFGNARREIQSWNGEVGRMRKEVALKADISNLQARLDTAQRELKNPNLTKERRAKLNAEISQLQTRIRQAQGAINGLRGKTVVIRYSATGVNLTTPSSVGRRQHGGPVTAGQPYIVGEKREELFVPEQNGTILPSIPTGRSWPGASRQPIIIQFNLGSGSNYTRALLEDLRKSIRIEGGNVQAVLGP